MKLLAYFGSDLSGANRVRFLQRASSDGCTLLALDSDAMAAASEAELDFTVMDDWLDPETVLAAIKDAAECETGWYEAARDEFTVDGICWPEFDHVAMQRFWQDALGALAFAEEFKTRGGQKLTTFAQRFKRPSVFDESSDILSVLWQATLRGKVNVIRRSSGSWRILPEILSRRAVARLSGLLTKPSRRQFQGAESLPARSVVLVLGQLEALRFAHVIKDLAITFPGQIAAIAGGPYVQVAGEIAAELRVPVQTGAPWPLSTWVPMPIIKALIRRAGAEKRFVAAYEKTVTLSKGKPWEPVLGMLRYHFAYYCTHRWPALHTLTMNGWRRLWEKLRPRAVIVTNVWTSYYLSASVMAQRLGIPTFLMGHGAVQLLPQNLSKLFLVDRILYESPLQRLMYRKAGALDSMLVECKGLIAENEYPVVSMNSRSVEKRWRILALLNPTDQGQHLIHSVSLKAQMAALRALASIPSEMNSKIDLVLKVHPFYHDMGIINAVGSGLSEKVLPPESDLHQLIQDSHLIIAVNYVGSALIHVFRAGKPVVHFQTEAEPFASLPDSYNDLFVDGCEAITNPKEFWTRLERIISDSEFMTKLAGRSKAFGEKNLVSSEAPTFAENIERLLA